MKEGYTMTNSELKLFMEEKITNANYSTKGAATLVLDEIMDKNSVQLILDELSKEKEYSRYSFDFNQQTSTLYIIDPEENLEEFEHIHPSRKPCN